MRQHSKNSLFDQIVSVGTSNADPNDIGYIRQSNSNGLFFFTIDFILSFVFYFIYNDIHIAVGLFLASILFILGSVGLNSLGFTTLSRLSTASIGSIIVAYCAFYLGEESFIAACLLLGAIFPFVYFSLKNYISILICLLIPFTIYATLVYSGYNYGPKISYSSNSILAATKIIMFLAPYLGILMNSWVAVSEREKKNEELARSKKLIESIFFALSHDLANPIQSLSLLTRNNINANNLTDEKIQSLKKATNQTIRIYNNLKDIAKTFIEGKLNIPASNCNLVDMINESIFNTLDLQKSKNIVVNFTPNTEVKNLQVLVIKDIFIFQVLTNFITNAIKFSNEGASILIDIKSIDTHYIQICIKDQGIGIEKDKINKLFDWKERTTTIGTNGEKGTGLGLPLANMFVTTFGGFLEVESVPASKYSEKLHGTEIKINLPIH
jgi:signal transduction histidine kinase